jgi:GDP-4-dehydro-6-deoxy-D-mannose reductase
MRLLITGITGFAGTHLARLLLSRGEKVAGVARDSAWNHTAADVAARVELLPCDLCDLPRLETIFRQVRPEQVYHLAGFADAGRSFRESDAAWRGNLEASRCLYEAILRWGGRPRVLHVSSGAVYGEPEKPDQLIDERTELRPNSPYAAGKAAADLLAYQVFRTHGLPIIRARPFNHIGPGQSPSYAIANFARQIAAIERAEQPPVLHTGNLWAERDLTDVRDVAEAYKLLLQQGEPGEAYNIASGRSLPMQAFLDRLLSLSKVRVQIETDAKLARSVDSRAVRVDSSLVRRTTGWKPVFSIEKSLADTLDYWRSTPARRLAG